jgi:outer membrane protein TolC
MSSQSALGVLVAVAVLTLPVGLYGQVSLTLKGAIERGLENNEQYRTVLAEEKRAGQQIKEARAEILPEIRFDASYTRVFELPTSVFTVIDTAGAEQTNILKFGTRHNTNWGFSFEQSLWEGGRVFAALSAARHYRNLTDASSRQANLDLQAQVGRAFLGAWLARRLVTVAEQTLAVAEENFAVVDKKYQQGLVSEYDHLRAQVRTANLRPSVIEARNQRELTDSQLRKLIGIEPSVPLELIDSEPDSSAWEDRKLDELVAMAKDHRGDLSASDYEVNILKDNVRAAQADYWPTLKLSGNVNWQVQTDDFGVPYDDRTRSWQGMLTLSYPIFDGFRRAGTVGVAKVDLAKAKLRRQGLAKNVSLEVEQARNDFIEATERLQAQEETVGQAQRGLEIANLRYESGVGTQLEVLDAQLELTTARINAESARHDRLVARAQWRRAMGEPVIDGVVLE